MIVKKGEKPAYDLALEHPNRVSAPTKSGDKVGRAIISKDGSVIKEINLIVKTDIDALSLKDCFDKVATAW